MLFSGTLNKQLAKVKVLEDENKRKLKFTCVVTGQDKKMQVEHLEVTFLCLTDLECFQNVYVEQSV